MLVMTKRGLSLGSLSAARTTSALMMTRKLEKLNPAALRAVAVGPTKNIWHVFNGNDQLIKEKSSDGSTSELAVYIGLLDGKLKIVR